VAIYEIKATTVITASPDHVWAVLDNIHGWRSWMPSTKNIHIDLMTPGSPRLGYRFRLRGKITYAVMEIIEFHQLERSTKFQLNIPPLNGTNRCVLVPLGDGRHRLERVDQIHLPGPVVRFLDSTQRERFEKLAAEFLLSLKRAVDQEARQDANYMAKRAQENHQEAHPEHEHVATYRSSQEDSHGTDADPADTANTHVHIRSESNP
jgi:uncharacterized protein YndB with AHSA1/START domain